MSKNRRFFQILLLAFILLSAACGGGSNENGAPSNTQDGSELRTDSELDPGTPILSDPGSIDAFSLFPALVELRQSEATNLMVGYTSEGQLETETAFFDAVWLDLRDCLGVSATPPLIVIQSESVEPLTGGDDIFLNFFGQLSASANDGADGASIQILASELHNEQGNSGFILRSILGRYLWRFNDLPERDFDTSCVVVSIV